MLDTLEHFHPESPHLAVVHARSGHEQSITIAELLSKSVSIEWYEAVAITQAVCDKLHASGCDETHARVAAEQVSIDQSGAVRVAAIQAKDGPNALDEIAALLRKMLADTSVPTPLRLALSQTAVCNSLYEWSKAIAYYERPNRAAVIQTLYHRAASSASAPVRETVPALPAAAESLPEAPVRRFVKPQPRYFGAIAIAVIFSFIAAAGVWTFQTRRPSESGISKVPDHDGKTLPNTLNTAVAVVETLVNRIPLVGSHGRVDNSPPPSPSGRWIHLRAAQQQRAFQSAIRMPVSRSFPLRLSPGAPTDGSIADVAAVEALDSAVRASVASFIYSVADTEVVPPVAVYPQFPSIPAGTDADDIAEFDVVVTASGDVESVRARRTPRSLAEALTVTTSLSAAKTWRFRPGLRNGEPVKYLHVISILKSR